MCDKLKDCPRVKIAVNSRTSIPAQKALFAMGITWPSGDYVIEDSLCGLFIEYNRLTYTRNNPDGRAYFESDNNFKTIPITDIISDKLLLRWL